MKGFFKVLGVVVGLVALLVVGGYVYDTYVAPKLNDDSDEEMKELLSEYDSAFEE